MLGLIATTAADLQDVVETHPRLLGAPQLAHGGLETDVGFFIAVDDARGRDEDGLHRERVGGDAADFLGHGCVLADRYAPLDALLAPLTRDLQRTLGHADAGGGNRETAGVQRGKRDFQAAALAPDDVGAGHADVSEAQHSIVDRAVAHELTAPHNLDARCLGLDDKGGDLCAQFAVDQLWRRLCSHDEQTGARAVGAPEFFAVEQEGFPVVGGRGLRGHARRVGADARLGQRERRDLTARDAREEFLLLFLRAEEHERLRHADRLVNREVRKGVRAMTGDQLAGATVGRLRETESAILRRNLDAVAAHLRETRHHIVGNLAGAVDEIAVHSRPQKRREFSEKFIRPHFFDGVDFGHGVNLLRPPASHEKMGDEADIVMRLARGLRHLQRGPLPLVHLRHVDDGLVFVDLGSGR